MLAFIAMDGNPGQLILDGVPYPLDKESAYLVVPGQRVELRFDRAEERRLYELQFDLTGSAEDCDIVLNQLQERKKLSLAADCTASSISEKINRHWQSSDKADRFASQAAFQELLHAVFKRHGQNVDALEKVRAHMQLHYRKDLSIDSLADLADMSRYYFMRSFKEKFGQSAKDYLSELRTNEAKRLLEEGGAPGGVAEAVGYKDPLYFSSQFKKLVGLSPKAYSLNRQCKVAAYSWPNIGHLLALQIIPFASPIDQSWTDDYRRKYRFDVKVPLSHDYDFNRLALERAKPDRIIGLDEMVPEDEKEKLRRIAPCLFLRWHPDDWRTHLRNTAEFLERKKEAERWLSRYEEQAASVRKHVPATFRQGKLLIMTITPDQIRVWGRKAGTVLYDDLRIDCAPGIESIPFMLDFKASDDVKWFDANTILISVSKDRQSQEEWERLQRTDAWRELAAVKNGNVHQAPSQAWLKEPYLEYSAYRHEQLLQELDMLFRAL